MMFQNTCKKHYGDSSKNITFSLSSKKNGKNAMLKTIFNALRRFRHALNEYYVHRGLSPLNRFGYIMPNEWDTIKQQNATPEAIALSNKMKVNEPQPKIILHWFQKFNNTTTKCRCSEGGGEESDFSNGHLVTHFYSGSSVMSLNHPSLLWTSVALVLGDITSSPIATVNIR
jgi:hypothetical protein